MVRAYYVTRRRDQGSLNCGLIFRLLCCFVCLFLFAVFILFLLFPPVVSAFWNRVLQVITESNHVIMYVFLTISYHVPMLLRVLRRFSKFQQATDVRVNYNNVRIFSFNFYCTHYSHSTSHISLKVVSVLLICGLHNNALNNSDYISSNVGDY
jgi:hypothetical protein